MFVSRFRASYDRVMLELARLAPFTVKREQDKHFFLFVQGHNPAILYLAAPCVTTETASARPSQSLIVGSCEMAQNCRAYANA